MLQTRALLQNLLPQEVAETLQSGRVPAVLTLGAPLLLVRIDEPAGALLRALEETYVINAEKRDEPAKPLDFRTMAADSTDMKKIVSQMKRRQEIGQHLMALPHFIVPVLKRKGAQRPFGDRVFLGRATNTDIVLRHQSVSKSHAWFEYEGEGRCLLGDAGSKNGTLVNGEPLEARRSVQIEQGDQLQFGQVKTVFSYPEPIWELFAD